ncbi:MAG: CaiB/BaiF CoA transferase family protein [Acidimicrobiia bacterium]
MSGPLEGIRVVEIAGLAPGPFCGMLLADYGAEVILVERRGAGTSDLEASTALLNRGKSSIAVDLKDPRGVDVFLRLVDTADALIEPFRPGVAERLGVGPTVVLARNPAIVYGRLTGWGQDGPFAAMAGHDINYIALSGALEAIGPEGTPPVAPINYLGDFAGGGMLLALGICAALVERGRSGRGQVIDAAMVDGSALLSTFVHQLRARGRWLEGRAQNGLNGGAHYYGTYECADGKFLAVGPVEPHFYAQLVAWLGFDEGELPDQFDRSEWPEMKRRFAGRLATKSRDEWCESIEGLDVCVAPVLSLAEAPDHPHNRARSAFVDVGGIVQPAPAPRFGRTSATIAGPPPTPGESTAAVLTTLGLDADEISELVSAGIVG